MGARLMEDETALLLIRVEQPHMGAGEVALGQAVCREGSGSE